MTLTPEEIQAGLSYDRGDWHAYLDKEDGDVDKGGPGSGRRKLTAWIQHPGIGVHSKSAPWTKNTIAARFPTHTQVLDKARAATGTSVKYDALNRGYAQIDGKIATISVHVPDSSSSWVERPPLDHEAVESHLQNEYGVVLTHWISGKRDGDVIKRISGNSDIGLNDQGKKLVRELGKRIHLLGGIDVLHNSTLRRAIETADILAEENPEAKRAAPSAALCPWRLGEYEGRQPEEVQGLVAGFVQHPHEVPPGKGADDAKAEPFADAVTRQLTYLTQVFKDWEDIDPTHRVFVVMHSRGMELLQAYVDAGSPDLNGDIWDNLNVEDLITPKDPEHTTLLRWKKNDIEEIDVTEAQPLKGGVYLVLHGLTDDDTDEGNAEDLDKAFNSDQPRDEHGRWGEGGGDVKAALEEINDKFPVNPTNSEERVLVAMGKPVVAFHLQEVEGNLRLKTIRSLEPGQGVGSLVLNRITRVADKHGVTMELTASPYGDDPHRIGGDKLREWYGKHGFRLQEGKDEALGYMIRTPSAKKSDALHVSKYLPPVEVIAAARKAYEAGNAVVGITAPLAEGEGLGLEDIYKIAGFIEANRGTELPAMTIDAWGGKHAYNWTQRVFNFITKGSPDQPRDDHGRWSSSSSVNLAPLRAILGNASYPEYATIQTSKYQKRFDEIVREQNVHLTPEQDRAIQKYTAGGGEDGTAEEINMGLREGGKLPEGLKALDSALENKLPAVVLYRGAVLADPSSIQVGRTFTDKTFLSTSVDAVQAAGFATRIGEKGESILFRIPSKEGQRGLALLSKEYKGEISEREVLLPRNSRFRIKSLDGTIDYKNVGNPYKVRVVTLERL